MLTLQKQHEHLIKVSRSFALTIPFFKQDLADIVSNAYLLCRIADTIEDDPLANNKEKKKWLLDFASLAKDKFEDNELCKNLEQQALLLCKKGAKVAEYDLLKDMKEVILRTRSYDTKFLEVISKGVSILSYGMAKHIDNFHINNENDVDHYCYKVAGVVGQMLALLFANGHNKDKLMELSISFGEGLQLTNILKDFKEDKKRNIAFLPEATFDDDKLINYYFDKTASHLKDAISFTCNIAKADAGIRLFCLVNIFMAFCTLKKIKESIFLQENTHKISHFQVKLIVLWSILIKKSNFLINFTTKRLLKSFNCQNTQVTTLNKKVSLWDKDIAKLIYNERHHE